ncbi:MAG: ACP S-malonyltransferase [Microcoleus sp. PH2017_25_DOB_D_A]|jgi:[acyl-carrier-protein] S-malonyltransferase|uniref:ACP S-malonyltransferase n=1 Tax=unclassified Microcoleus TaxID=2642155 RepID=UPI001E11E2AD|nr:MULTISPECIES: ACP S-malonyltransferase [unclassified Microcoleus]MCC3418171.1 ACP S-malonyltransferase [Microcoleus sp. PH2017_07_MST_O_A]MCC3508157.1 ACP S-malonyltransferase [Microcoleus sp. PH2017_17_BER_D_A]TAE42506.1 MAG: [acyl-carrier-protein] S-malonyltransferase [Oscillatoriales cyanobacterium]MCC3435866.1 ACP S-malonyltransferase [Microcoleus sp. PH2017_05_CCC_O_A]MCC3451504.1 ACP S-malonyltransferase [Microcoleus sp. PH2017_09_SFU_O_A]
MTKTAWVFPGQGSQAIGMGADLLNLPAAKAKFELAKEILGWSVPEVCQKEEAKLSRTLYTQPCLFVVESILADLMREKSDRPAVVAGHSLGEYVALYAAGVFDFETGLRLVKRRAELMETASGGQMVALIGFDRQELELQIQYSRDVVLANDNSEAQVVISGTPTAVEDLLAKIKVKRAVKLNVSGAFHSPLMAGVAAEFQLALKSARFSDAKMLVLSNSEPTATTSAATLKQRLNYQMTKGVRWREISLQLPQQGIDRVVEIGPGKVLTGLIKRTCPNLALVNVSSFADLPA